MASHPATETAPTSLLGNTVRFLLPLLVAYAWAMVRATGVPWHDFLRVAMLFASTAATMSVLVYMIGQGAIRLQCKGPLFCADTVHWMIQGAFCLVILLPSFGAFKQLLLPTRGFVWDAFLADMGRVILLGRAPWEVTHAIFGSLWATMILDRIYNFWSLMFMAFPLLIPFISMEGQRRAQLLIAWVLAWLLVGTLAAWIFASAGPCYYNVLVGPDASYAALNDHLRILADRARAAGGELTNIEFQQTLLSAHGTGRLAPAGGISAMPSMHVTMAVLIALAGRTYSRPLGHVLGIYGLFIWIASIHLGWHYAVDGPVAVVMMASVWRLSGRIAQAIAPNAEPIQVEAAQPCIA